MRRRIAATGRLFLFFVFVFALSLSAAQQPPRQEPQPTSQPPKPEGGGAPQTQPARPGGGGNTSPTPAKPIVPVAANTIIANPDPYLGEYISLTAAVGEPLTKSTFSVDQHRSGGTGGPSGTDGSGVTGGSGGSAASGGKDILIVAPTMTGTVEHGSYVTVLGELVKFDAEEIKKKTKNYSVDLPPDVIAKYKGKPVVVATAVVVNSTGVDIAKVAPPPLTAEEEAYQKVMRQVGPANTALRSAIDKMDGAAVKDQAVILSKAFAQTETFWKTKGKADAVGFAAEARKNADVITAAATAAKWDDIKAAAAPLGQQCASCHGVYRQRLDDGSFRIKESSR